MLLRVAWLGLVALMASSSALGEPRGLVWQAPASCPAAADVRQRIERRAGAEVERVIHGVAVAIEPRGDGYVARIDLRGLTVENDVRELSSARCDELTDAVAIVLARVAAELAVAPRPAPAVEIADPGAVPERRTPSPWQAGARLLGLSGIGAMPEVSVGAELAAFVRRDTVYAEVAGARWFPKAAILVHGAPGEVDIELMMASLRLGWAPVDVPVRTWVGMEVGSIRGSGVELGLNDAGSSRWLAATGGVAVVWRVLPRLHVVGSVELGVPFYRPRFVFYDGVEVFRSEPATVRSGLGLEVSM